MQSLSNSRDDHGGRVDDARFAIGTGTSDGGDGRAVGCAHSCTDENKHAVGLRRLHATQGRIEASFASKLVATVDPRLPVIDSIVLKNLNVRLPSAESIDSRIERVTRLHADMAAAFSSYLKTPRGRRVVSDFRANYSEAVITDTKIVDVVLWKTRAAAA